MSRYVADVGTGVLYTLERLWAARTREDLIRVAGGALEDVAIWTEPTGIPTHRSSAWNAYVISSTYRLRRREFDALR